MLFKRRLNFSVVTLITATAYFLFNTKASAVTKPSNNADEQAAFKKVFYNARLSARDNKDTDVIRFWLLNNSAMAHLGKISEHQNDFRSLLWAAVGNLGYCPDNLTMDNYGAGLWPLATVNTLIRNMTLKRVYTPGVMDGLDSFRNGEQARPFALSDNFSASEIKRLKIRPRYCDFISSKRSAMKGQRNSLNRYKLATLLLDFLYDATDTINRKKVTTLAAVEARIFDTLLYLADPENRKQVEPDETSFEKEIEEAYGRALKWNAADWHVLSRERRLFLFSQVMERLAVERRNEIVLGMIDNLISDKNGKEILEWIGFLQAADNNKIRELVWEGKRGERLLLLNEEDGFTERSIVAWHRGIRFLETGNLRESLRSLGLALRYADESRESEAVRTGSRRWIAFVAGAYEVDASLLGTLKEVLPHEDFSVVLQDLLWRSILRFDLKSYTRLRAYLNTRSAAYDRFESLHSLAQGKLSVFYSQIDKQFKEEPNTTARFLRGYLEQIEREDRPVRMAHTWLLKSFQRSLERLDADQGQKGRRRNRFVPELLGRIDSILQGLRGSDGSDETENQRALNPSSTIFAGNVRIPPKEKVPWPFVKGSYRSPSVFQMFKLQPQEWYDDSQKLVFGWNITE